MELNRAAANSSRSLKLAPGWAAFRFFNWLQAASTAQRTRMGRASMYSGSSKALCRKAL